MGKITNSEIFEILNNIEFNQEWLGESYPEGVKNRLRAGYVAKYLNETYFSPKEEDLISPEYIKELFPFLTKRAAAEFYEYCIKYNISKKDSFGDGKHMLPLWVEEVW